MINPYPALPYPLLKNVMQQLDLAVKKKRLTEAQRNEIWAAGMRAYAQGVEETDHNLLKANVIAAVIKTVREIDPGLADIIAIPRLRIDDDPPISPSPARKELSGEPTAIPPSGEFLQPSSEGILPTSMNVRPATDISHHWRDIVDSSSSLLTVGAGSGTGERW